MRLSALALVLALEAAAIRPAVGQAAQPSLDISSQVDRSEITIGDRITYEIKVVYPAKARIDLPSVLGNLGSFEVKDYQASEPKPAGTLQIQTWRFTLSTFTVGKYTIPPQQVVLIPDAAAPAGVVDSATGLPPGAAMFYTQPIEINVARTSPETVKDIADIAGPAELPGAIPWLYVGIGAALLIAAAAAAWFLLRRKQAIAASVKPALPPFEEAMERLAGLDAAALVRQNRARELCFALSEVLRRYVTRRWWDTPARCDAIDMTTTEFLAAVKKLPITAAQKDWLGRFCEATDMVKFAGAPILESDAQGLVAKLKEFLEQTKPKEVPEGQAAPGAAAAQGARRPARPGTGKGGKA